MTTEADLQRSYGCTVLSNEDSYTHTEPQLCTPNVRIGVSGSLGTGITSTARALAQALELPLMTEVARPAFEHGFTLGDEGSIKAQCAMWFSQFFLESREPSFVADRTLVDAVAHAELLADLTGDKQDRLIATVMSNATPAAMQNFTALFYTPIEFPLIHDGVRKGDIDFQRRLDEKFLSLFERLSLPYVTLAGSVKERTQQALVVLDSQKS